jgi:hypothetical protein
LVPLLYFWEKKPHIAPIHLKDCLISQIPIILLKEEFISAKNGSSLFIEEREKEF